MGTIEFLVIALNVSIILVAYLSVYPKLAENSFNRISFYDILASGLLEIPVMLWYFKKNKIEVKIKNQ